MDLDEWEYLPDDAFLDFHEQSEKKKVLFSKRYFDSTSVFNMYHDYYIVQSANPSSSKKLAATDQVAPPAVVPPNQLAVPVQIQLLPPPSFVRSTQTPDGEKQHTQDPLLSQVHFNKTTWEPESVDMKMDSPKSPTRGGLGFGFVHQTTSDSTAAAGGAKFEFDDYNGELAKVSSSPRMKTDQEEEEEKEEQGIRRQTNNIWKLSFTGIGAICSFGFAAATICVLFLGSHHQSNHKHLQIYTDDTKRIKEVVHRATKFDEAFSAVRGVPLSRAHITSGGYYTSAL